MKATRSALYLLTAASSGGRLVRAAVTCGPASNGGTDCVVTDCPAGTIACCLGLVCEPDGTYFASNPPCSDATACNGQCCVGDQACEATTGCIATDGSCSGTSACQNAIVGLISGPSCSDAFGLSCYYAGSTDNPPTEGFGDLKEIIRSCNGAEACRLAGSNGGKLDSITDSCNADRACTQSARRGATIGPITSSCNFDESCGFMAENWQNNGVVNIGGISAISSSCNEFQACQFAASTDSGFQEAGTIGDITNSCTGSEACKGLAFGGGEVGHVTDSCNAEGGCFFAATSGGKIAPAGSTMYNSCNALSACYKTVDAAGQSIASMNGSCNEETICQEFDGVFGDLICFNPGQSPTKCLLGISM